MAVGRPGVTAYAATARRVLLRERGRGLPSRLRGGEGRLVFVVGSPRSGTTFLAGAIGAVPGFADLTEVTPLKAAIPSLVALGEAEQAARIRAILERVRTLALVRGVRGVEQTPETAFVLAAALRAYPDARAVHVVRDGRDVVCSLLDRGWLSAGHTGADDARLPYGAGARFWVAPDERAAFEAASDAGRAAWAWRAYVTAARSVGERVLEVRYESLAQAAPALAAHLEVDAAPLAASLGGFHDRSVGRHREDLSPAQLEDVERVAGPLLRALGYAAAPHRGGPA
ncbi:MAG TPA: sulfotransferase [Gaiellaceae bacterium]|nr:sulfotransferase [Gaiellaceae bacterium]